MRVHLDTHVIVWLYMGDIEKISDKAQDIINSSALYVSPIVKLELEYLYEIKRISKSAAVVLTALQKDLGLEEQTQNFSSAIDTALGEKWTRDPFDRILASHAKLEGVKLITKDNNIRANYSKAIWD